MQSDTPLERIKSLEDAISFIKEIEKRIESGEEPKEDPILFVKAIWKASKEQNEEENGTASCKLLWNRLDKWQKEWAAEKPKERKLVINDSLKLIEWKIESEKKASREDAYERLLSEMSSFEQVGYCRVTTHEVRRIIESLRSNPVR